MFPYNGILATVVDGYSAVFLYPFIIRPVLDRLLQRTYVPIPTFHGPVSSTGH